MKNISFSEENQKTTISKEPYEKFERKVIDHFPDIDYLKINECIGKGTFSHVYKGIYHEKDQVAIKIIDRGSDFLINNEIEILTKLKGLPYIIQLYEVIYSDQFENDEDSRNGKDNENSNDENISKSASNEHQTTHLKPSTFSKLALLVFEYLDGINGLSLYQSFSLDQIKILLRSILEALSAAHDLGVVHRDVKLSNIFILKNFSEVKLIDWGCAAFVNECMSSKSGSRECRPPEMLLGYQNYGCGCDIWALGIVILFILTGGIVPWKARTSGITLIKMSEYVGGNCLIEYAKKLNIEVDLSISEKFYDEPQRSIESDFNESLSKDILNDDLIKLMKKCLTIDYKLRPTAKDLLESPFFIQ